MPPTTLMEETRRFITMAAVSQAGGGQSVEEGAFAGRFVEMEGLGVVLLAEFLDLLRGHGVGADGIEMLANLEVLEVKLLVGHRQMSPDFQCMGCKAGWDRFSTGSATRDEQHGDVVATAVGVGGVHQRLAGFVERAAGGACPAGCRISSSSSSRVRPSEASR